MRDTDEWFKLEDAKRTQYKLPGFPPASTMLQELS